MICLKGLHNLKKRRVNLGATMYSFAEYGYRQPNYLSSLWFQQHFKATPAQLFTSKYVKLLHNIAAQKNAQIESNLLPRTIEGISSSTNNAKKNIYRVINQGAPIQFYPKPAHLVKYISDERCPYYCNQLKQQSIPGIITVTQVQSSDRKQEYKYIKFYSLFQVFLLVKSNVRLINQNDDLSKSSKFQYVFAWLCTQIDFGQYCISKLKLKAQYFGDRKKYLKQLLRLETGANLKQNNWKLSFDGPSLPQIWEGPGL